MRCLRKLAVGLGDFRLPKWDSRPKPRQEKRRLRLFDSCFLESYAISKSSAGNFIETLSERPLRGDCSAGCLSAGLPTRQEQAWHAFFSSLILFPPYSYIFANLILYTLSKTKYCVQSESQTSQQGHYQISNSL